MTTTTKYDDAVNMKEMLVETRRIACDFIISSARGGGGYTDPDQTIDAIVELLSCISVVEDHFRDITEEHHEREREERRVKAVSR